MPLPRRPARDPELRVGLARGCVVVGTSDGRGFTMDPRAARCIASEIAWGAELLDFAAAGGIPLPGGPAVPILSPEIREDARGDPR
jgi:hypothetical protein